MQRDILSETRIWGGWRGIRVGIAVLLMGVGGAQALVVQATSIIDRNILLYQHMLQRDPTDVGAYYRLGDAYMQKARESGDATYYDLAEQALQKALDLAPHYSQAVRHLAYVLYSRHAFHEAVVQALRALQLNPADRHAYGVLGDAYLELGRYAQAQDAYEKMQQLQADFYSYSRLSGLTSLLGDPQGAIADLKQAILMGQAHGLPRESIAWTQWQLGNEYFAYGNLSDAETAYQAALTTYPTYHRGLAGLAARAHGATAL